MNVLFYLLVRHWNGELKRKIRGKKPRLYVVILKCFWWRILVLGLTMLYVRVHCTIYVVLEIDIRRYMHTKVSCRILLLRGEHDTQCLGGLVIILCTPPITVI